jgi:hypothetical protein
VLQIIWRRIEEGKGGVKKDPPFPERALLTGDTSNVEYRTGNRRMMKCSFRHSIFLVRYSAVYSPLAGSLLIFYATRGQLTANNLPLGCGRASDFEGDGVQNLSLPVGQGKQILSSLRFPGHALTRRTQSLSIQDPLMILLPLVS